jgi:glycosyltransferase involved in cell wall biosynthesis
MSSACFSVVMAAYNAEPYIAEAIESALGQTCNDLELHVIDDGSTDGTRGVVERYLSDTRVRYYYQANAGQCPSKNLGIALSKGEFVAFLDADDVWLQDKLSRQYALFEGRPDVGVVYGFLERIGAAGESLQWDPVPPERGDVSSALLMRNFVPFSAAAVRRRLLERHGGFDPALDMGIDYDLWLRLSMQCDFDFIPEVVGRYRVWPGQMSRNVVHRYQAGMRTMQRFLERYGGRLSKEEVDTAWAHTFVGRGNSKLWSENEFGEAWIDFIRALRIKPLYWPTYRSMVRSLVLRRAPR